MNGNTVLQFVSIQSSRPKIFDTGNPASISYQVIGQYAVLPGVHQSLLIKTATGGAVVLRALSATKETAAEDRKAKDPSDAMKQAFQQEVIEDQNTKLQLMQALEELDKTKRELADLKRQLAEQQSNPAAAGDLQETTARLDHIEQQLADTAGVVVRVNFDFASTAFSPDDTTRAALLAGANAARRINVRGRTDSPTADQANYSIALGRALATRQFLMKNGVDGKKIHLFAQAAGGFVADNSTDQGRRLNRRVEIELIGPEAVKVVAATKAKANS